MRFFATFFRGLTERPSTPKAAGTTSHTSCSPAASSSTLASAEHSKTTAQQRGTPERPSGQQQSSHLMHLMIRGPGWTVERVRLENPEGPWWGDTDWDSHTIRIDERASGHQFVDTLIHEVIHASLQDAKEKAVAGTATAITEALEKIGYRKYVSDLMESQA
jgi:hypothetical protein